MKKIRSFTGANVYSHRPALVMELDSKDFAERKSGEISGFNERLLQLLPGLAAHFCNSAVPGNFTKRLKSGLPLNQVIEHVALELMALCGVDLTRGKSCGDNNTSKIVIETTAQETAQHLLSFAVELVEATAAGKTPNIEERIAEAKRIAEQKELDSNSLMIVRAAEKRSIPWIRRGGKNLVQLGYGANLRLIQSALTGETSHVGIATAIDENLTKQRLNEFSIPVPDGEIVSTEEQAVEAFKAVGAPVIVKPLHGQREKDVSFDSNIEEEVRTAFRVANEHSSQVLIEEKFGGVNYSILIVGGKMIAAVEKPLSNDNDNDITIHYSDVTDQVHSNVKNLCERTARVIGLDVCAVDLVTENISVPLPRKKAGVVAIDAAPNLQMYAHSTKGKPRDIGGAIVGMLYPGGKQARIPIISITGTNGKTSVTRMTAHILGAANLCVGVTTSTGIYLNGERIAKGDTTGPASARTILGDPAVEAAVLETARGGIVRRGLGYDWSDVSVMTNVGEDHIGQDGIESIKDLINIKALVAERTRAGGALVLNADDENSLIILDREKVKAIPKHIVYFSLDENNPHVLEHTQQGGTAYFLKNGFITESIGQESFSIVKTDEIPVTLGGTAEFQVANAMAAFAACRAVGIQRELCASGLQSFRGDADNPGRNNLYKVGAGYVLVDYGHNADGFAAVCRMARRWTGKTVTGIIGLPGDRDDRIIKEAAQVAARGFDRVIVTEEVNRREREVGEMAKLLCDAIKLEKPGGECEIVLDEVEAFSKALAEMRKNEVVVIFYRQFDLILEVLARNGAVPVSSFEETAATN